MAGKCLSIGIPRALQIGSPSVIHNSWIQSRWAYTYVYVDHGHDLICTGAIIIIYQPSSESG